MANPHHALACPSFDALSRIARLSLYVALRRLAHISLVCFLCPFFCVTYTAPPVAMPRPLSVAGGGRQTYQPPVEDYRKRLGKKEVHAPANKALRRNIRDAPAHKASADATQERVTGRAVWGIVLSIVLCVVLSLASVYATGLDIDTVVRWIPNDTSTARHWIGFMCVLLAGTLLMIGLAFAVFYATGSCVPLGGAARRSRKPKKMIAAIAAANAATASANATASAAAAATTTTDDKTA